MPIEIAGAAVQAIQFLYGVGRKVSDVVVDETVMRELRIPRPRLTESPEAGPDVVREFFESPDGRRLLAGMPDVRANFEAWTVSQDAVFLETLLPIFLANRAASRISDGADRTGYLTVKAYLDGARPVNTAFQRILGEVVNQGLDFLAANPGALGVSPLLQPVLEGLAEQDLAEARFDALLKGALGAVLGGLDGLAEAKIGSKGLRLLTSDLIDTVKATLQDGTAADFDNYFSLRGPLLQRLLRSAANAAYAEGVVPALLLPMVDLIRNEEGELFTAENGAALVGAALESLGTKAPDLAVPLLRGLALTLSTADLEEFDLETLFRRIGISALEHAGANLTVFFPNGSSLAVSAAAATLRALKSALAAGVFDQALLTDWMNDLFLAVGENAALRSESAIHQVVAAVARAIGADSSALLTRDGRRELLSVALQAVETQAPTLLDSNLLGDVLQGVIQAAQSAPVSQAVLLDLVRGALEGAAEAAVRRKLANVEPIVRATVEDLLSSWKAKKLSLSSTLETLPATIQAALVKTKKGKPK